MNKYLISWKSVEWQPNCSTRTHGHADRHDEARSRFFAILRTTLNRKSIRRVLPKLHILQGMWLYQRISSPSDCHLFTALKEKIFTPTNLRTIREV